MLRFKAPLALLPGLFLLLPGCSNSQGGSLELRIKEVSFAEILATELGSNTRQAIKQNFIRDWVPV